MVSSITIGDGADFATISLWQQSRRNNIVDNIVNDELTLLGGTYGAGVLLWDWPTDTEELSINVTMQAHPSALHNGDWDSGVCLSGGTQSWKVKYNDLNVTYRDIVFKKAQVNIEQGTNYFGSQRGIGWDMSSVHHGSLTFDRCMIYTEGQPHTRINYESYTPSSNPSAFGTFEANYNNCILEDTIGPVYPDNGQIMPSYQRSLGDHTYNFRGCTLSRQGFLSSHRITNYAPSASLTVNLSGCIEDTSSAAQSTLIPGHAINLGYYPGGAGFPSSLSAPIVDHITNEASGSVYDWAQTKTNVSYGVPFNFDGTVTSGQVNFVDNAGASSFKDYRLVADPDNLAVQYMNVSNTSNYDLAGRRRPGLTDAGAFQSYSDSVVSALIGSGVDGVSADHATVALFYAASGDKIVNGQTFDLAFQNQIHDFIVNIGNNPLLEVDQKWIVRGDTIQDGEWDTGARFIETQFLGNQQWWGVVGSKLKKQDVIFELKDLVFSSNIYHRNWAHFNASREIRDAAHDCTYTFDRCLISTARGLGWPYPNLLANNEQTGEFGLNTINIINTVVSGNSNYNSGLITPYQSGREGPNVAHNFVGSTFYHRVAGYISPNGSSDYRISGCLFDMHGNDAQRLLNYPASRYNVTAVDNIFSNSQSYEEYSLGTDHTNCTFDVNFNYDGSVKSGQVSFVSSTNDFRLVPDLDNLAVKYMTSGELPYKDITGYKRPGGIDQRDAGAYQSISDKNTVYKIGTSSVDFPADYATLFLWSWNDHFYANILNGETHTLQFKSGEIHDPAASINFNGTVGSVSANVNQSFVYSGQTPHNGNWDEGAILAINGSTNGAQVRCGKNSFNFTVKDLSLVASGNANNRRLLNTLPTHNGDYTTPGYFAPEHTYTFENFMARMDDGLSSITYELMTDNNYERITDEDLNILERGTSKSIHKNCLYVGAASSDGVGYNGSLCVYSHQNNTQASAFFQTEGCTFINSWFSDGRHAMILNQLKVDHAGLLYYAGVGRGLSLHAPYAFAAARYPDDTTTAVNNSKFVDCIFSNGAGDSIATPASQDRYSTWVIEPLPSEYRDSSSGIVEFYQPWNVWASALTNCSFRVPFNFDGSVSAGTVSFVDGSSGVNNYRLVGSEDNFASGYVSSFNLSGLDLAGNDRGDSPYV